MQPRQITASRIWSANFLICFLEGVFSLVTLIRTPADSASGVLFGFSAQRLALIFILVGLSAACAFLAWALWRSTRFQQFSLGRIAAGRCAVFSILAGLALILAPQTGLDLLNTLYHNSGEFRFFAYFERLAPLFNWLSLAGLQLILVAVFLYRPDLRKKSAGQPALLPAAVVLWAFFLLIGAFVHFTGVGIQRDTMGSWGVPTVPVLEWQIWFSVGISGLGWLLLTRAGPAWLAWSRRQTGLLGRIRLDWIIVLGIASLTAFLWTSQPIQPAYFATPGRAPNFEIYPFSDAAFYDQYAQSVLIGHGFMADAIPQRALYVVFLAGLHLLAGQKYLDVILLQSLILAVFPAVLYCIGKELHSRPAGILAAMLVIFREITAIHSAPFTDNISYSKLYFSEIPTAICLSLFVWMVIRWLKAPGQHRLAPLFAGGFLGMAMLIRTQSFIVLPFVLVAAFLVVKRQNRRQGLVSLALLLAGLVICISPWLWRNWKITGGLAFDNPASQTMVLAQRYNDLMFGELIPYQPGETDASYSSRLMKMAVQGMLKDPPATLRVVSSHFLNNEIANVFVFPIRFSLTRPAQLLWPDAPFWQDWRGVLTPRQALLVLFNLGLLALAVVSSWKKSGPAVMVLLWTNLAYNLSTAVFRSSGERFLVPVDWVFFLLYAVGIIAVLEWALSRAGFLPAGVVNDQPSVDALPSRLPLGQAAVVGLCFLLVGASLPLAEVVFPDRYPPQTRQQLETRLLQAAVSSQVSPDALAAFLQQPGTGLLSARVLYPRFYAPGESEPKTAKTGYAGMDFSRLVFSTVGQSYSLVVFPLDQAPDNFPNTADVLIAGCQRKLYFEAALVVVQPGHSTYLASGGLPASCAQTR